MKTLFLILLPCLLSSLSSDPLPAESMYRAGMFQSISLYWVPRDGILVDTVGWAQVERVLFGKIVSDAGNPASGAASATEQGKRYFRLKKCPALVAALLVSGGTPVVVLSQWQASLREKVIVPIPGMVQHAMRHRIVSPFVWERIERVSIEQATMQTDAWKVNLYLSRAGFSTWDGRDILTEKNAQILGTQGFSVAVDESDYEEDMHLRRQVFDCILVVSEDLNKKKVVSLVESAMDRQGLDLSYPFPEIEAVTEE